MVLCSLTKNWQAFCYTYTGKGGEGIFETAKNYPMPFGRQLVNDLISSPSNNHHLICHCCYGNKYKNPTWPPKMAAILYFRFLRFCLISGLPSITQLGWSSRNFGSFTHSRRISGNQRFSRIFRFQCSHSFKFLHNILNHQSLTFGLYFPSIY